MHDVEVVSVNSTRDGASTTTMRSTTDHNRVVQISCEPRDWSNEDDESCRRRKTDSKEEDVSSLHTRSSSVTDMLYQMLPSSWSILSLDEDDNTNHGDTNSTHKQDNATSHGTDANATVVSRDSSSSSSSSSDSPTHYRTGGSITSMVRRRSPVVESSSVPQENENANVKTQEEETTYYRLDQNEFTKSTWMGILQRELSASSDASSYQDNNSGENNNGNSPLWMTTTTGLSIASLVVIHPLAVLAGAATAIWAVGILSQVESGYDFWDHHSFSRLFWSDSDDLQPSLLLESSCPTATNNNNNNDSNQGVTNESLLSTTTSHQTPTLPEPRSVPAPTLETRTTDSLSTTPIEVSPCSVSSIKERTVESGVDKNKTNGSMEALDETILRNVTLGGLTAYEFFQVYFANDAPFGFSEFQAQRGDINIQYGSWEPSGSSEQSSTKKVLERTLSFKTLTKSYFGPTYATANKEQRATLYCDNENDENVSMVVVDSKTRLLDIPFGDRFHVLERVFEVRFGVVDFLKHGSAPFFCRKNPEPLYWQSEVFFVHNQGIYRRLTINAIRQKEV
eukprot:scaffold299946_cov50-Attheya_sp.AAC.2